MNNEQLTINDIKYQFEEIPNKGRCLVPINENPLANIEIGSIIECSSGSKFMIIKGVDCNFYAICIHRKGHHNLGAYLTNSYNGFLCKSSTLNGLADNIQKSYSQFFWKIV